MSFKANKENDEKEHMMGCWRQCKSKCIPKFYSLEPCVEDCKANKCDLSVIGKLIYFIAYIIHTSELLKCGHRRSDIFYVKHKTDGCIYEPHRGLE